MNANRFGPLLLGLGVLFLQARPAHGQDAAPEASRVVIESDGWHLVGDLLLPAAGRPLPGVLMLNKAAGDRSAYREFADQLAARGVASLRLDLRGHGESTNLGSFVPGEQRRDPKIWDAEADVTAALRYLRAHPAVDAERLGVVGSSYSGEEMAEAGRAEGYARAYVTLSPGSFSEASIQGIDASGVPWLFIAANNDRFLAEITDALREQSRTVELLLVPGTGHATDLLQEHPELAERIAVWLAHELR
jgi:dienelactone hydrolase